MTLLIQQNQPISNLTADPQKTTRDWVTADFQRNNSRPDREYSGELGTSLDNNLPLAAKRAEQLIDALGSELSIEVAVSYMRVESAKLFHVLLLLSKEDFLSPKIQAARLIAEKIAAINGTYDIRFSFAIESENMMENGIRFSGYRLMHVREN